MTLEEISKNADAAKIAGTVIGEIRRELEKRAIDAHFKGDVNAYRIIKTIYNDVIKPLKSKTSAPTMVEVVPCEECAHGQCQRNGVLCEFDQNGPLRARDAFCSSGERREEK